MPELAETVLVRPGCEVFVRRRESTNGRWVVFLHGAGADARMFDPQLPAVPPEWGVCAWDARGHGRSALTGAFHYPDMVADLAALVDSLDAVEVVLVGQSMGGNLAQTFAAAGGRVDRLVLLDCTDNHGPLTASDRLLLRLAGPILSVGPWRSTVKWTAGASGTREQTRAYMTAALLTIGRRRFVEVLGFWRDALTPDPAYRLPVPTLLLRGEADTAGNIATMMETWAANDPAARLVVVPGAGHTSNLDAPEVVNDELTAFLGWR